VISGVHCPVLCIPVPRQEKESATLATETEGVETRALEKDMATFP
jgi:hypothetical protein